jgi:hypothetical protein
MELKNLSDHTQRAYLEAVTGLSRHYKQSPNKITDEMIDDYLFNQEALSRVFRGKFMQGMRAAIKAGDLKLADDIYGNLKNRLYVKNWVVSVRKPVKRPEHVLE